MMRTLFRLLSLTALMSVAPVSGADAPRDTRCYELRTYYAAPGKLEELNTRFREHTCALFAKHGMVNLGYWVPLDNPDNKLIYLLAYPSREAREKSWKEFMNDPAWQAAYQASEANGKLVAKFENVFLEATDYSPSIQPAAAAEPRVFELRTYTAARGKLGDLNARFRDHTVGLFAKHGLSQVGYWVPMKDQKGADDTLMYLLVHKSREAAAAAFKEFGQDPDWVAARKASEEKAGGPLTVTNGVQSVFLKPTDYSAMK